MADKGGTITTKVGESRAATVVRESAFGPNNLRITETVEKVTIEFDPRCIIGEFKTGNPKVASTGSYRPLDVGGKMMLHVIGKK